MARAVVVLTKHLGMTEAEILSLPMQRIQSYLQTLKELNSTE